MSISTVILLFAACKKDETRATVLQSSFASPGLAASQTTLVLDSANATTTTAVTFNWPSANFGQNITVSYTLQIDSVKGNFAKPVSVSLGNLLTTSYTKAAFNALALSLGLTPGTAGQLIARVKADVNQYNGSASTVPSALSNVLNLTVTTYSSKPKPIYPVPDSLYLVGDATPGGWSNPVPTPSQKFTRIDDNTFGIVINMTGGKQFLLLPVNGSWAHKYAITGAGNPSGGTFVPDAPNNMTGPTTSGLYQIIVDFVKGTYTITPAVAGAIPSNLYIVGDATAGGWNNPVPTPSQQFKQVSSGEFVITLPLTGGKSYLFLPVNGSWSHKYGGASKTGGALLADNNVPGSNTPAPDQNGTYTIDVNFFSLQYTVK